MTAPFLHHGNMHPQADLRTVLRPDPIPLQNEMPARPIVTMRNAAAHRRTTTTCLSTSLPPGCALDFGPRLHEARSSFPVPRSISSRTFP